MAEVIKEFEQDIDSFALIPSDGGKFEFKVNGRLLYSKLQTGRHVEPGEILGLLHQLLRRQNDR